MPGNKTAFNMKVGIDIGATLSQFESDIASVISQFNAKQHNIKIGFDLKSAQDYKALIDDIAKTTEQKLDRSTGGGGKSKMVTDLTKAKDLLKEYYKLQSVIEKNKSKFTLAADKKTLTTSDKNLQSVAKRITEVVSKYQELVAKIKPLRKDLLPNLNGEKDILKLNFSKSDIDNLERIINLEEQKLDLDNSLRNSKNKEKADSKIVTEAIAAKKKEMAAQKEAERLLASGDAYQRKDGIWSSRRGAGADISAQVKNINLIKKEWHEYEEVLKSVSKTERDRFYQATKQLELQTAAKEGKKSQTASIKAQAVEEKKITDEAIATAQKFHSLMYEGSKGLKSGALSVDENGVWHARHKDYDQLEQSLNGITVKYQQMVSAVQNVSDAEKERFKTASKASKAEIVHLEDVRKRREDEIKGKKAIQDGYSSYAKMQKNLKNWSAAGGIFASKDTQAHYANYAKAADDLGKLVDGYASGKVTLKEFADGFTNITENAKVSGKAIQDAGKNTQSFGTSMATALKHIVNWVGATRLIMSGVKAIKDMAKTAIEIESSMAQLEIVTHATDSQMEAFLTKSTGLAKELGKSITEVLGSVETFSRLGYNLEDASGLAKYANILSNVANVDVDTATTGLTSIIKGYGMDVSNSEHVADVLVEVGQKYAISAEELMAAFQRGGAALAASGTDFEKSAALFAATNASLQNAESVGKHICPAA